MIIVSGIFACCFLISIYWLHVAITKAYLSAVLCLFSTNCFPHRKYSTPLRFDHCKITCVSEKSVYQSQLSAKYFLSSVFMPCPAPSPPFHLPIRNLIPFIGFHLYASLLRQLLFLIMKLSMVGFISKTKISAHLGGSHVRNISAHSTWGCFCWKYMLANEVQHFRKRLLTRNYTKYMQGR